MTIQQYFNQWTRVVDTDLAEKCIRKVINTKQDFFPHPQDVFKAFRICPYNNLRTVILADYPDFYKQPSLDILRSSFREMEVSYNIFNFEKSLEKWAQQGMLMISACLTCATNLKNFHADTWSLFTRRLLNNLSKYQTSIIYVLIGSLANNFEPCINSKFNHIIKIPQCNSEWNLKEKLVNAWKQTDIILNNINGYSFNW